jgi:hypothetical protein
MEAAAALRALMAGSAIRASHRVDDPRVQDPYCLRCQPQVMGAALDVLRRRRRRSPSKQRCFRQPPRLRRRSHLRRQLPREPVAFAADAIALAICEIGSIAERRVAMLVDPALSGLPAFLTPRPGLNSGFMIPQVTAAALVAENKQMAHPASVDSIPTSANQEDHVSMATHERAPPADGGQPARRARGGVCSPRRRAATSIRPSAVLAAAGGRAALCCAPGAAAGGGPPLRPRHPRRHRLVEDGSVAGLCPLDAIA